MRTEHNCTRVLRLRRVRFLARTVAPRGAVTVVYVDTGTVYDVPACTWDALECAPTCVHVLAAGLTVPNCEGSEDDVSPRCRA